MVYSLFSFKLAVLWNEGWGGGSLPHFPFYLHTVGVCMRARVRTQVMLLMPAMMIGVMNRHSEDETAM